MTTQKSAGSDGCSKITPTFNPCCSWSAHSKTSSTCEQRPTAAMSTVRRASRHERRAAFDRASASSKERFKIVRRKLRTPPYRSSLRWQWWQMLPATQQGSRRMPEDSATWLGCEGAWHRLTTTGNYKSNSASKFSGCRAWASINNSAAGSISGGPSQVAPSPTYTTASYHGSHSSN